MKTIGQRIRDERRRRNLTLDQLAQQTKLSKSFLSQVERGQAQPSITSLKRIAQVFALSMVDLFAESSGRNGSHLPSSSDGQAIPEKDYVQDVKVVRANQRKKLSLPGSHIMYEMVTPDLKRRMQVLLLHLEPGDTIGEEPIVDPAGEKCLLLLRGSIEHRLGDQVYTLTQGDSVYFPANLPQSWRGIGEEPIEAVIVLTPPWF